MNPLCCGEMLSQLQFSLQMGEDRGGKVPGGTSPISSKALEREASGARPALAPQHEF